MDFIVLTLELYLKSFLIAGVSNSFYFYNSFSTILLNLHVPVKNNEKTIPKQKSKDKNGIFHKVLKNLYLNHIKQILTLKSFSYYLDNIIPTTESIVGLFYKHQHSENQLKIIIDKLIDELHVDFNKVKVDILLNFNSISHIKSKKSYCWIRSLQETLSTSFGILHIISWLGLPSILEHLIKNKKIIPFPDGLGRTPFFYLKLFFLKNKENHEIFQNKRKCMKIMENFLKQFKIEVRPGRFMEPIELECNFKYDLSYEYWNFNYKSENEEVIPIDVESKDDEYSKNYNSKDTVLSNILYGSISSNSEVLELKKIKFRLNKIAENKGDLITTLQHYEENKNFENLDSVIKLDSFYSHLINVMMPDVIRTKSEYSLSKEALVLLSTISEEFVVQLFRHARNFVVLDEGVIQTHVRRSGESQMTREHGSYSIINEFRNLNGNRAWVSQLEKKQ